MNLKNNNINKFEPDKPIFNIKISPSFNEFIRELIIKNPNKNPFTLTRIIEEIFINNKCDENETIKHFCTEEYNMNKFNNDINEETKTTEPSKKSNFDFKKVGKIAGIGVGGAILGVAGTLLFQHITTNKKVAIIKKSATKLVKKGDAKKIVVKHMPSKPIAGKSAISTNK